MPAKNTIKLRRDTANNWATVNPVLANGEPGYDTTNNKLKFGDGTNAWSDLSYQVPGNSSSIANGASTLTVNANGNVVFATATNSNVLSVAANVDSINSTGLANVFTDRVVANTGVMANGNSTLDFARVEGNVNALNPTPSANTVHLANLTTSNSFIYVSGNNTLTDTFDMGVVGNYDTGSGNIFEGFYRDATDFGAWKVFDGLANYPINATVNTDGITSGAFESNNLSASNIVTAGNITADIIDIANILSGDASNMSNLAQSSKLVGGTSNIIVATNSNVTFSVKNVANVATVTGNGLTIANGLVVSGTSNLDAIGNITITGGTSGQVIKTDGNGNLTFAQLTADKIVNGTSNITTTANSTTFLSVDGTANVVTFAAGAVTSNVDLAIGGNVSANVITANLFVATLDANANAQPNITSLGTLTDLAFNGDPTGDLATNLLPTGNVVFANGTVDLGSTANVHITGGTSGQLVQTNGLGGLTLQDNENFPGAPWKLVNKYAVGQVVKYMGALYIANGGILANTAFKVGATGATWSPLSQMLRLQQIDLPDYPVDSFITKASYENASTINIAQTTPAVFLSLDDPMLGTNANGTNKTRILFVNNTGSASLTLNGLYNLSPNYGVIAVWTGLAWQFAAPNPALSNWIFTESLTGLYFTGKSGSIYADDTIITTTANVQVPLNVEGIVAANLSGTGNLLVFGGGNATMTGNSSYTGTTQVKYATTYTLVDNGLLGVPVANIYTFTGGTKTTNGTSVTQTFTGNAVMIVPDTPVPSTFTITYYIIGGGGGGGAGGTYSTLTGPTGGLEDASTVGGAGGSGGELKTGTITVNSGTKLLVTVGEGGAGGYTRGTDAGDGSSDVYNFGNDGATSTLTYTDTNGTTQTITAAAGRGGTGGADWNTVNSGVKTNGTNFGRSGTGGYYAFGATPSWRNASDGFDGYFSAQLVTAGTNVYTGGGGAGGGAGTSALFFGNPVTPGGTGGQGGGGNGGTGSSTGASTAGGNGTDGLGGGGGGGAGAGYGRAGSSGGKGGRGTVVLRYSVNGGGGSATGGTVTTSGALTVHTFTATDVFQVPATATFSQVNYLAVGGGGAGGSSFSGNVIAGYGGGEGGEVKTGTISVTPGQVVSVTIGKGGNGHPIVANVAPNIGLVSGTTYDATGKGAVTSIDDIASDPLVTILPASGTLKYKIATATGSQTVSVSFKKDGTTLSQSAFTLAGNTLAYTSAVNTILVYAEDDHDNVVMDADGRGIIARTNQNGTPGTTNWDKFRGNQEVLLNSGIDAIATYPVNAFAGSAAAVTFVSFPGTTTGVWINKTTGQYKVNNFTAQSFTVAEATVIGTATSNNVTWHISDGINQFLIGQYNSAAARLFTVNLANGVLTSTAVTLATAPAQNSANDTEEDMFGAQLFTIDGAVSFYNGTTFYYGGTTGFKTDTSPLVTTGRTTFTASTEAATQTGQDVFGSIDATGNVWFADWGHDSQGMFASGQVDNGLGTRQTNIQTVAAIAGSATPNTVTTAGVVNGKSTILGGVGMTTITAVGGNGGTTSSGATGTAGANGGASGTGNGSAGSAGTTSSITGTSAAYGGGGGGGKGALGTSAGVGGSGGGGTGGGTNGAGIDGVNGGGGGGAGTTSGYNSAVYGGNGGDGLVIITYSTPYAAYDATYANSFTADGNIVHNSWNNEIFTGTISGSGNYHKKKYTSDTFANAVTLTGNINVDDGTLLIGNGSAGSTTSTINLAANTTLQFKRNGTAASPYSHTAPINGLGNIEFLSTNTVNQSRYDFTSSNIANVTGSITVKANASLLATSTVFGNSNVTVESTGAISVTSGNLTANVFVAGSGWTNGSIDGAISLTGSANIRGNVTLLGDTTIAIANGTSNSTMYGNISGNYSLTYKTPANTVRMTLNGNGTYTGTTTISSNTQVAVSSTTSIPNVSGLSVSNSSTFLPLTGITVGNLSGDGTVFTGTPFDTLTVGLNNMDSTFSGKVNQGAIAKVGTGTLTMTGNSYTTSSALNGNSTTVTMGNLVYGAFDTTGFPTLGNITVTQPGNLYFKRSDNSGGTGNGIALSQHIGGNGNVTLSGSTSAIAYHSSPELSWYTDIGQLANYRYPDNTNFTGNIWLSGNTKYSILDAKSKPTKVVVESRSQVYLGAPWTYQFYTANGSLTLGANSYTIQGTLVGGGGGAAGGAFVNGSPALFSAGTGGAGGGITTFSETARAGGTFSIVVGQGGAGGASSYGSINSSNGVAGTSSTAFGYSAVGGAFGRVSGTAGGVGTGGGGSGGGQTSGFNTVATQGLNGTVGTVTTAPFNTNFVFSTGGPSGSKGTGMAVAANPLPGASTGGNSTVAPTTGTMYGCGGGGGGGAVAGVTNGSAGQQGMVAIRYFENSTAVTTLATDFILNGDGWNNQANALGALRSDTTAWTLTGNITIASSTKILADNQPLYIVGNITGSGNLALTGNAAINLTGANNTLTGTVTVNYGLYLGDITNTCSYSIGGSSFISASASGVPTTYTTTGSLTMALNSRMKVVSNGTNVLSSITVASMTVSGAWFIDMLSLTATSGTYTLISFPGTIPSTVPSLGTNNTGKTVVFSYVDGTGLVVTLS